MVNYKSGRKTDKYQFFYIPLTCGQLDFSDKIEDGTDRIEKIVKYMNDNNITNWQKAPESFKIKCLYNNIEYRQIG